MVGVKDRTRRIFRVVLIRALNAYHGRLIHLTFRVQWTGLEQFPNFLKLSVP